MEIDSVDDALLFASENELIIASSPTVDENLVFLEVSPTTKGLHLFYTWGETLVNTQPMKDVWRPFVWVQGATDVLGTNMYLSDISLGHGLSVHSVLTTYFKAKPVTTVDEFNHE
jgi:hypothetical protein